MRYANAMLTVIAVALLAIVAQNAIAPAQAQMDGCGTWRGSPCYVEVTDTVTVNVDNTPLSVYVRP